MSLPFSVRTTLRRWCLLLGGLAVAASAAADPAATGAPAQTILGTSMQRLRSSQNALADFFDRLPDLLDFGLPSFAPPGDLSIYAHPRFGDLIHEDYFRIPVGGRVKLSEDIELNSELGTYFTHGLRSGDAGNGLYQFGLGLKREQALSPDAGWSSGIGWVTPLSRPPHGITDGLRHTLPFVTFTRTIVPSWGGAVGFVTVGGDLLARTHLQPDYIRNELRADSLVLTLGMAREWRRMHVILQVYDGSTALLSHLHENVFGIRPSVGIPFMRRPDGSPRAIVTFEGRAVWGPDGFETGVNTSVRVDFRYHHHPRTP